MSTESVLAAMFASPALNVLVLAMIFTLFPLSLALLKLATVLFLILVFVPIVSVREKRPDFVGNLTIELPESETWNEVLRKTGRSYAKAFWQVFRVAFPLLVLAAILGSFAVELIPQQALFGPTSVKGIVVVAAISAFLPVPMAFDVAIAYILMIRGVPLSYVAVILCMLGIISVYSLSVAGQTISWRIAGATYAAVVIFGVIAGICDPQPGMNPALGSLVLPVPTYASKGICLPFPPACEAYLTSLCWLRMGGG